ncbi:MAG: hypothetical protein K0R15_1239 [Clostridiales bacterium]|jgi:hypothetical protein|nr:hypothetical protein [Clostridiales bacterium]
MDRVILCAANSYEQKYYLNPKFENLPDGIKDELKVTSVIFTEDNGGILTIGFDEDGFMFFETSASDFDYYFDEIGSGLIAKKIQREKLELWDALERYYQVFFLNEDNTI